MPAELQVELTRPTATVIRFELEPAHNSIYSLMLLNFAEHISGLDEWVTRTYQALSPERRHNNRLVLEGLHYAVTPIQSFNSFENYLDDLAATDPVILRDRLLERLTTAKAHNLPRGMQPVPNIPPSDLLDKETYLLWLAENFGDNYDPALESEAHDYLVEPARMHALILYHLQTMWRENLRAEWQRVHPMLQEAVTAFRAQDWSKLDAVQVARQVTGQEPKPYWENLIQRARRFTLIPSAHTGPYPGKIVYGDSLWMLFGAHLPAGARIQSPALVRSELLVRLSALDDDIRLQILELLAKRGELCAQDVITLLDISQPAASRHLKQLSATGYITERRRDGNKCYALNRERLDDTWQLLRKFLA